jgi:endonuclease/exonuclease/phosphatase family metal-dependent hydrolase
MSKLKYMLVLVFAYGQIQSQVFSEPSQVEEKNLKIMSYNIWNGFDWGKDEERRAALTSWINSKEPDVVALQELCGYTEQRLLEDAKKWGHNYAIILKTGGYPVGLTSSKPIVLKEKVMDDLWHGMLHCKTWGIDVFVVHLSPADRDFRYKEAGIISEKIKAVKNENYVVLGDFNAHSPFDGDVDLSFPKLLKKRQQSDLKNEKHNNLLDGQHDYSVMSTFLSIPLIDVLQRYVIPEERFTFPGKALIGIWQTAEQVEENKSRIDYIMASRALAKTAVNGFIFNRDDTGMLSDHYPIMAEFQMKILE